MRVLPGDAPGPEVLGGQSHQRNTEAANSLERHGASQPKDGPKLAGAARREPRRRTSVRRARYAIGRTHRRAGSDSLRASRGRPGGPRAGPGGAITSRGSRSGRSFPHDPRDRQRGRSRATDPSGKLTNLVLRGQAAAGTRKILRDRDEGAPQGGREGNRPERGQRRG